MKLVLTLVLFVLAVIAQNNWGHSWPKEDEFILIKQNDQYGLTRL